MLRSLTNISLLRTFVNHGTKFGIFLKTLDIFSLFKDFAQKKTIKEMVFFLRNL